MRETRAVIVLTVGIVFSVHSRRIVVAQCASSAGRDSLREGGGAHASTSALGAGEVGGLVSGTTPPRASMAEMPRVRMRCGSSALGPERASALVAAAGGRAATVATSPEGPRPRPRERWPASPRPRPRPLPEATGGGAGTADMSSSAPTVADADATEPPAAVPSTGSGAAARDADEDCVATPLAAASVRWRLLSGTPPPAPRFDGPPSPDGPPARAPPAGGAGVAPGKAGNAGTGVGGGAAASGAMPQRPRSAGGREASAWQTLPL